MFSWNCCRAALISSNAACWRANHVVPTSFVAGSAAATSLSDLQCKPGIVTLRQGVAGHTELTLNMLTRACCILPWSRSVACSTSLAGYFPPDISS
jgi:hypothetical protein